LTRVSTRAPEISVGGFLEIIVVIPLFYVEAGAGVEGDAALTGAF